MELAAKMFIRARQPVMHKTRGQTMTEYALILVSIAVVATAPTRRWATASISSPPASIPFPPARMRDFAIKG